MFVSDKHTYWVKFQAKRIEPTADKPHGIDYSLTLHGPDGKRIVGYDNAHPVQAVKGPGGKRTKSQDHRHRYNTVRPYKFVDAGTLVEDFWKDVGKILKEKGVAK
jgi:hypothetical protein